MVLIFTEYESFGYTINDIQYISTPFADDFNLITTNKWTHQRIQLG